VDNLILAPGNNNVSMHATISQTPIVVALQMPQYCHSGTLPFVLGANNVTNHGQYLAYFAEALGAANQTTEIDIGDDFKKDLNTTIVCKG